MCSVWLSGCTALWLSCSAKTPRKNHAIDRRKFTVIYSFTVKIMQTASVLTGAVFALERGRHMETQRMDLRTLTPADYNPRVELKPGDPEWEALNSSIEEFDCVLPIIWNETTGNIVGGHQRRNVLLVRGVTEDTVVVVHLDLEEEKILNVLLNKVKSIWEVGKLTDLIKEIREAGGNLLATGFTELEVTLMGEDFGHIEDLLQEDFSDVGKTESATFMATFTLPEEHHQSVNRYIEDYGKAGLSKAVMDRVKGLA